MLKKIGLKNVRSFKDLKDLEIKPITVLCGTNSSGKSTILKSLLLWKQTLENLAYNDNFLFNGKYTNLGQHDNLLHNNTKSKLIKFNFQFEMSTEDIDIMGQLDGENSHILFARLVNYTIPQDTLDSASSIIIDFTLGYKINVKSRIGEIKEYNLTIIPIEENDTGIAPNSRSRDGMHGTKNVELKVLSIKDGSRSSTKSKMNIEWKNLLPSKKVKENTLASEKFSDKLKKLENGSHPLQFDGTGMRNFSNILELQLSLEQVLNSVDNMVLPEGMVEFTHIMGSFRRLITKYFSSVSYLGPLREEPSRRYIYDNPGNDIGTKGENSAFLYHKFRDEQVTYRTLETLYDEHPIVGTLETTVREWLDEIGILDFDVVKTSDDEVFRFYLNSSEFNEEKVNIADVGFGVSQVVPIVIAGLLDHSETLILEQPEIHLHPKMQMKLADFILSMALSGKKFIIETHSEHIINRFVRRIVEDENGNINSLVGINFVKNTEKGSKIEKVKITEKNGIVNWPDEFFDQAAEEHQKIMNAIIHNKMANKK